MNALLQWAANNRPFFFYRGAIGEKVEAEWNG
jgi:hypothetical protein